MAVGKRFIRGEPLYLIANLEHVWVLADVRSGDASLTDTIGRGPAITVHADAVIDSGTVKRVFIALGNGQYELREVQTGWQEGDRVEIRDGLKAGERVVTAGAFLLDSESRMKDPEDEGRSAAKRSQ